MLPHLITVTSAPRKSWVQSFFSGQYSNPVRKTLFCEDPGQVKLKHEATASMKNELVSGQLATSFQSSILELQQNKRQSCYRSPQHQLSSPSYDERRYSHVSAMSTAPLLWEKANHCSMNAAHRSAASLITTEVDRGRHYWTGLPW